MPSMPSAQQAALPPGESLPALHAPSMPSELDDVAAAAARLTARYRRGEDAACALDAIPHLARPLAQLRRDTRAAFAAHPAPPSGAVHASAVRLLATADDFRPDRLRRAVDDFGAITRNPARAAAALADAASGLSWLDDPAAAPQEDLSAAALQARHRDAIVDRAGDHLRLDASLAARKAFRDAMERDLAAAKIPLLAALHGAVDPSAAIPTPFSSADRTPDPRHGQASAARAYGGTGPATFSALRTYTATPIDRRKTPASSGLPGRPPRSAGLASGSIAKSRGTTPSSLPAASFPNTPGTGGSFGMSASPTPSRAGTPNPRNVITTDPDADYLSVVRDHVLGTDIPSEVASRLLEQGRMRGDHPHFLSSLTILAELSSVSAKRSSAEIASPSSNAPSSNITFHDIICSARSTLESFFAQCIGDVPLDLETRSASAVRAGVRKHVANLVHTNRIRYTHDMRNAPSDTLHYDHLPFWPQFYYCLRCGSPSAALTLADDAHEVLDEEGVHFRFYLHEFLRQGERERAAQARRASSLSGGTETADGDTSGNAGDDDGDFHVRDDYMLHNVPGTLTDISHQLSLAEEYEHYVYQGIDPYRRASYVLLSRLDVAAASGTVNGNVAKSNMGVASLGSRTSLRHRDSLKQSQSAATASETARCSLRLRDEDYGILFDSMEDFYWLKLWLCRTEQESDVIRRMGDGLSTVELTNVQDEVQGFGHSYFDADGTSPLLYAFILVATGLPWQAIEYLASQQSPIMSAYAAYLALPMNAMGWAPSEEEYGAVIWSHVIHFACDHPAEAALCLFTLRDRGILGQSLQQLVVDTRKYAELLGDGREEAGAISDVAQDILDMQTRVQPDHAARGGDMTDEGADAGAGSEVTIVQFIDAWKRELANSLGDALSRPSRSGSSSRDAITASLLYAVSGDEEKERDMILTSLGLVAAVQGQAAMREDVVRSARRAVERGGDEVGGQVRRSLEVLLEMCAFFDDYWAGRAGAAWGRLVAMDALPLDMEAVREKQRRFARASSHYAPAVAARLPDLLRAALELAEACLGGGDAAAAAAVATAPGVDGGAAPQVAQVHSLVAFAGLMGLSETELSGRLVRLELLLS